MKRSLTLILLAAALFAGPASLSHATHETIPLGSWDGIIRTAPIVALNVVPGFGLGSYLQGETRTGIVLSVLDVVGGGLVAGGLYGLSLYPEDDEDQGGWAALMLLSGYGVLVGTRVAGVASPLVTAAREGVDSDTLFPAIFYNTLPGFGIGSTLQQDFTGATIASVLDLGALVSLGVLSFTALAGAEIASNVAAGSLIGFFVAGRVYGIVRPLAFSRRADQTSLASAPHD